MATITFTGLTNSQQAVLMMLAFILGPVAVWFGLGAPTDHQALALLGAGMISGVLAFIKEILGTSATPAAPVPVKVVSS